MNGVKDTYGYGKRPNFIFNKNFWSAFKSFYTDVRPKLKNFEFSYDISKLFENSSDKDFVDHVHYSKVGNEKVAIKILKSSASKKGWTPNWKTGLSQPIKFPSQTIPKI